MEISLKNLLFAYEGRRNKIILNIPSWEVASGEIILVNGPSGSGKTTLLNILSGLFLPNKGIMNFFGYRLDQMNSRNRDIFRANYFGYVFQQFNLISYLNVVDNIRIAANFSSKNNTKNLDGEIKSLLDSLNIDRSDWESPARSLSVGQQQRVAIARSLINKPRIILADEPTSSLDNQNKEDFMSLLMSLVSKYKITLVFVSHDQSIKNYFNRVEDFSNFNIVEKSCKC